MPTGPMDLTLFDTEEQQAISDMVRLFQEQLKTATTPLERRELELAIQSWTAAHAGPKMCDVPASTISTGSLPPPQ